MISSNHPSKWSTMHSTVEAKYENLREKKYKNSASSYYTQTGWQACAYRWLCWMQF